MQFDSSQTIPFSIKKKKKLIKINAFYIHVYKFWQTSHSALCEINLHNTHTHVAGISGVQGDLITIIRIHDAQRMSVIHIHVLK